MPMMSQHCTYNYSQKGFSREKNLSRERAKNTVDNGYYYYGARYYDPMTSVWLSVDPLADKYPSLTPYAFVLNNPVSYQDPNGMWVEGAGLFNNFFKSDERNKAEIAGREAEALGATGVNVGKTEKGWRLNYTQKSDGAYGKGIHLDEQVFVDFDKKKENSETIDTYGVNLTVAVGILGVEIEAGVITNNEDELGIYLNLGHSIGGDLSIGGNRTSYENSNGSLSIDDIRGTYEERNFSALIVDHSNGGSAYSQDYNLSERHHMHLNYQTSGWGISLSPLPMGYTQTKGNTSIATFKY